ncbi:MAG TPA: hypothetical protein VNU70_03935, partial [Puia sp.]|nr:hypothetical protein [Puia sp.]
MTMYLLLRNNKQSGPHSLEELKNMGLKAYDLVWLEGKSAAWRYPCEIAELTPFAPAVEEQPFDRFYKKATASAANGTPGVSNSTLSAEPVVKSVTNGDSPLLTGKRSIYVNLPAGRTATVPLRETYSAPAPAYSPVPAYAESVPAYPSGPVDSNSAHAYSSGPIDPKSAPANLSGPVYPKSAPVSRSAKKDQVFRILAVGVCILALLAAGIFIGLSLNKGSQVLQQRIASKNPPSQTDQPIIHNTAQQLPAAAASSLAQKPVDSMRPAANVNAAFTNGLTKSIPAKKARKDKEKAPATLAL